MGDSKRKPPRNYVRIDNDLGADENMQDISEEYFLAACGLHVLAIGYCDRKRTDGRLTRRAFRLLAPEVPETVVQELVRVGVWAEEAGGDLTIRSYLRWQKSRAEIEQLSEQARKAAQRRWDPDTDADRIAECNADSDSHSDADADSRRAADINARAEDEGLVTTLKGAFKSATGEDIPVSSLSTLIEEYGFEVVTVVIARIMERVTWDGKARIHSPLAYLRKSCESVARDVRDGCEDYTEEEAATSLAYFRELL